MSALASPVITFELDGVEVDAFTGETIWQAAKRHATDIPHLCYADEPGYRADGNCRVCMVEIEGTGAGRELHPHSDGGHESHD